VDTHHFGELADHVKKTIDDLKSGAITPEEAREQAHPDYLPGESPDKIAEELRLKGHHDAAAFYERQAHKANELAAQAIRDAAGPAPPEEEERPEPKTVEELEDADAGRVPPGESREVLQRRGGLGTRARGRPAGAAGAVLRQARVPPRGPEPRVLQDAEPERRAGLRQVRAGRARQAARGELRRKPRPGAGRRRGNADR
jgi:hypothetical protein